MAIPSSVQNLDEETLKKFREILKVELKFEDDEEKELAVAAVEKLSEEELDAAARVFYSYWALKLLGDDAISPEIAKKLATKVTTWHVQFLGSKDVDKIANRVKAMIKKREELQLEKFRTCFDKDATSEFEQALRKDIVAELGRQPSLFVGMDKAGRALFTTRPRTGSGAEDEAFLRAGLYNSERMVAISEYMTMGEHDKVAGIVQHQGETNGPARSANSTNMSNLQQLYPARMGKLLVLNAPFLVRKFFGLVKPLLPKATQNATMLISGSDIQKELAEILPDYETINSDGDLIKEIDMNKYLTETPYYMTYQF